MYADNTVLNVNHINPNTQAPHKNLVHRPKKEETSIVKERLLSTYFYLSFSLMQLKWHSAYLSLWSIITVH